MTPDEFRTTGYALIDWLANYQTQVSKYPVRSQVMPGDIRQAFPQKPPESSFKNRTDNPNFAQEMIESLENKILPGITHWQSPSFFAYFPANADPASILGDLLSSGLGVQGMLWITSPACTELETLMCDWIAQSIKLPNIFFSTGQGGGVIQDSASSATLCALIAAREQIQQVYPDQPLNRLRIYVSQHTHASGLKAARITGLGASALKVINTDLDGAMDPIALQDTLEEDLKQDFVPCIVIATVGTTATLAIDPISDIGQVCKNYRQKYSTPLWLHVDGAMAGAAAVCREWEWIHEGLEFAQSYCFNPHKWWGVNFDCDCFYVSDRRALIHSLSVNPDYLTNRSSEEGTVIDYRDWQIPLGRRFRALKIWFYLQYHGLDGIRQLVRRHIMLTKELAQALEADHRIVVYHPQHLNLICFRLNQDGHTINEINQATAIFLEQLNQSGQLYMSHATVNQYFWIRLCVGQLNTMKEHTKAALSCILTALDSYPLSQSQ